MKTLHDYLALWGLSDLNILAETRSSTIHLVHDRSGRKLVLKHIKPEGHEERTGAHLLEWYSGGGAAEIVKYDQDVHLIEFCDGPDLKSLVEKGQDREATKIIADVVQKLFAARPAVIPSQLTPLQRWFQDLFKKARQDQEKGIASVFIRAAASAEKLLATQTDTRPLHGDLHHENILHSARGWLAIDPKGLMGDSCYEFSNIFRNPDVVPDIICDGRRIHDLAKLFSERFSLDIDRLLEFAAVHACLSAAWDIFEKQKAISDEPVAKLIYSVMESRA